MTIKKATLVSLLIAVLAACASGATRPISTYGDNYTHTRNHVQGLIRQSMQQHDIVGLSIAIVDDQDVVWAEGFGFADKARSIAATPETIYRAGSITKLMTATAVMQLAERGWLDIDQPLSNYLPEFRIGSRFGSQESITLRNIMTHHSGLPTDRLNGSWGDETAEFTELVTMLGDEYVATPPNTIESYSNLGYALLGHVVERVSGEKYADYVENHILRPAGMQHAYVAANIDNKEPNSKGYAGKRARPTPSLRDVPAGGLNSSVVDLAHFAQMTFAHGHRDGQQILRAETLHEMQSYQDTDGTFDVHASVGLAWRLADGMNAEAGVVAGHNGGMPMFYSEFLTLPKHKLAVVVLANSSTAAEVVQEIAGEALQLALESKTGIKPKKPVEFKASLPTLQADLKQLPGYWSTPMGLVQIHRSGSRLKFEVDGHKLNLVRREDGYYHLQYKLLGLVPINLGDLANVGLGYQQIEGREVIGFFLNGQPRAIVAEKIATRPLPAQLDKYLGRYESINTKGSLELQDVELKFENGLILVTSTFGIDGITSDTSTDALWMVADDEAIVHGLGRSKGENVRFVEADSELLLSYSGYLLRKVSR